MAGAAGRLNSAHRCDAAAATAPYACPPVSTHCRGFARLKIFPAGKTWRGNERGATIESRSMARVWTASGRAVLLSGLVLCALRPFVWCGDREQAVVEILSPREGDNITACTELDMDAGRVRVPVNL